MVIIICIVRLGSSSCNPHCRQVSVTRTLGCPRSVYPFPMNTRPEDTWNRRYAAEAFYYGTAPNDFLREVEPSLPRQGHVLCLGEGEGRNVKFVKAKAMLA